MVEVFCVLSGICVEFFGGGGNVNIIICGILFVIGGFKFF